MSTTNESWTSKLYWWMQNVSLYILFDKNLYWNWRLDKLRWNGHGGCRSGDATWCLECSGSESSQLIIRNWIIGNESTVGGDIHVEHGDDRAVKIGTGKVHLIGEGIVVSIWWTTVASRRIRSSCNRVAGVTNSSLLSVGIRISILLGLIPSLTDINRLRGGRWNGRFSRPGIYNVNRHQKDNLKMKTNVKLTIHWTNDN